MESVIQDLGPFQGNRLYIKRDDLLPYSFGGNKARKAVLFFREIDRDRYDAVVTYGSSRSNHCRVTANMAAARGLECVVVSPDPAEAESYNSRLTRFFGARVVSVSVSGVAAAIEDTLQALRRAGKCPYFIPGGGHGNLGVQAYVECYEEIRAYPTPFDYLFLASGTGTTQAGLICGKLKRGDDIQIVGVSIARENPRGRQAVLDSARDYLGRDGRIDEATVFLDDYVGAGYGQGSPEILSTIREAMIRYGIPLDSVYTGKAFLGMEKYLAARNIAGKSVLFLHTGGAPLFFDDLSNMRGNWDEFSHSGCGHTK